MYPTHFQIIEPWHFLRLNKSTGWTFDSRVMCWGWEGAHLLPFHFTHLSLSLLGWMISEQPPATGRGEGEGACCQMLTASFAYRTGRVNVQLSPATIHLSMAVNHNQGYASVELGNLQYLMQRLAGWLAGWDWPLSFSFCRLEEVACLGSPLLGITAGCLGSCSSGLLFHPRHSFSCRDPPRVGFLSALSSSWCLHVRMHQVTPLSFVWSSGQEENPLSRSLRGHACQLRIIHLIQNMHTYLCFVCRYASTTRNILRYEKNCESPSSLFISWIQIHSVFYSLRVGRG